MNRYILLLTLGLLQLSAKSQKNNIDQFSFLAGGWQMKTEKGLISEIWVTRKDSLIGKSYRQSGNENEVLTESVIIKSINGTPHYCVTGMEKSNEGTTNFKLISSDKKTYIFENKAHDFPQRIVYQNLGKNKLLAWIEGEIDGKKMKSEFRYTKRR